MVDFKVSSFCTGGGCVEVGQSAADRAVIVRDAKDPLRSVSITFRDHAWITFLDGVRRGDFDTE